MGETGRQTLTPVSDVMLARYVAGDLHGDQLARVERAIGETPGLADRLERMRSERAAFLASNPPEQVAHQIVTRLTVEKPHPSRWQVWWLLPPVSVATALLIGVVYQRAMGPQPLVAPVRVTTDDTYVLPETKNDASPPATAAAPAVAPEPWREQQAAEPEKEVAAKAEKRQDEKARRRGAGKGAGNLALDGAAGDVADRDASKGGALGRLAGDDNLAAHGSGGGAGGAGTTGRAYAQPPPATKTPAGPTPVPGSPPVWADAPADSKSSGAPAQEQAPAFANKPAARTEAPAPPSKPEPVRQEPKPAKKAEAPATASSTEEVERSVATAAPAAPREAAGFDKADVEEKAKTRAKDVASSVDAVVSVTLTRDQGGAARPVSGGEIIGGGSLLKVTAQGGTHVTVVGVRRDGTPHIYAQGDAGAPGQPVTLALRVRPTSARTSEALFVIVGDAPLTIAKSAVSGAKDAAQLPLRLAVSGTQRRYVISVSAAAD